MQKLIVSLLAVAALAGCDATAPTAAGPPLTTGSAPAAGSAPAGPPAADGSRQTLWSMLDSAGNKQASLPDSHPDVVAVRALITRHAETVDNRDHRTVAERAADEYAYYLPAMTDALRSQDYQRKLIALYTDNHLRTRLVRISWYESTFYQDLATARVDIDVTIEFAAGDPAYLGRNELQLATPYLQHRTIDLAKQDGTWLIARIDKRPLTRGAAAPR